MAYRIDTAGTGDIPSKDSQVRLQYIGKHIDDIEFDRSASPVWQSIRGVLPGWRVALLKMPAGSKWTLVIPPHLAYGEDGAADRIGPHETLVFEIHLLEVR
jgi:FKBP-type peptidyl-prolyl cis-trans isomerase FklB